MAKPKNQKKAKKKKKIPCSSGKNTTGYKNPPKEHQFQPGQSGNPAGPGKGKTNLWIWFCKFMNMSEKELAKYKIKELTISQRSALKLAKNMRDGKCTGSEKLATHIFNREQGKPVEHFIIGNEDAMSDEECEEIRQMMRRNLRANDVDTDQ